ncbi:Rapid ALkalinization Factor [Abeliophyllum distichum]|uniref:Rapid ALkalinization Factor n=1 Tax=Abeliophyllum distichum TaxID=126358 RepID=A0ABD1QZA9_9LAMI
MAEQTEICNCQFVELMEKKKRRPNVTAMQKEISAKVRNVATGDSSERLKVEPKSAEGGRKVLAEERCSLDSLVATFLSSIEIAFCTIVTLGLHSSFLVCLFRAGAGRVAYADDEIWCALLPPMMKSGERCRETVCPAPAVARPSCSGLEANPYTRSCSAITRCRS